jgi:hypothetical protein
MDQERFRKAIEGLAENFHFKMFIQEVARLREEAHAEAEELENTADDRKTAALLGKAKALREIMDLAGYDPVPLD